MRYLITIMGIIFVLNSYAQTLDKFHVSGIVISSDSVPIPGVAIIDIHSGKIVHTDNKGNFHMEFPLNDSLLIYHIAYKKQFINNNDIRKYFVLQPEVHELMQVDILNKSRLEKQFLDSTLFSIKQLAPQKKLTGYDKESRMQYFVDENGSLNKGFSPYFGPRFPIHLERNTAKVLKREQRRQLKKLTAHYHLDNK